MESVSQSGSHVSACTEYTGRSDEISGGRVVYCPKIVSGARYTVYGIDRRQSLPQLVVLLIVDAIISDSITSVLSPETKMQKVSFLGPESNCTYPIHDSQIIL